jgi:acylphosphatase
LNSTPVRLTIWFSGNVQGVGFRQTSWRIAQAHPVSGWVKNLPDGRVEMLIEGSSSACNEFLATICGRLEENIRDIEQRREYSPPSHSSFDIIL